MRRIKILTGSEIRYLAGYLVLSAGYPAGRIAEYPTGKTISTSKKQNNFGDTYDLFLRGKGTIALNGA